MNKIIDKQKKKSKYIIKYEELKKQNINKIYLFEFGSFYAALEDDAILLNEKLKLKITKFGNNTIKVGFPINSLDEYIKKFKVNNINFEILKADSKPKQTNNKNSNNILHEIRNIDLSQTTPLEAFNLLYKLQKKLNLTEG